MNALRQAKTLLCWVLIGSLILSSPAYALRSTQPTQTGVEEALSTDMLLGDVHLDWVNVKPISEYEKVSCALCGRSNDEPIGAVRINGETFHVVRCRDDGLMWLNPQPDTEYYRQLYSEKFFNVPIGIVEKVGLQYGRREVLERRREDARLQVEEWEKEGNIIRPGKLVEIGGGAGFLSKEAQTRGWDVLNVEMSEYAADLSRKSRIPTYTGTLDEALIKGVVAENVYDIVAAYALIEHLSNPNEFLEQVRRVLKEGGVLAARIPATPDAGPRLCLAEHVYHYTIATFTQMLSKHGFVVTHQHYSGSFGDRIGNRSDAWTFFAQKRDDLFQQMLQVLAGLEETRNQSQVDALFGVPLKEVAERLEAIRSGA